MTTDFKALSTFRAYAAQVLEVSPEDLTGGPIDEAAATTQPNTIGKAWAFTLRLRSDAMRNVRGWATDDGTVITAEEHLGVLFAESGIWNKKLTRTLDEIGGQLAERLVWSYGMHHKVVLERTNKMAPPELKLYPKGDGKLVFFSSYRQAGPGGTSGGPLTFTQNTVTFTADRQATLTKTPM